MSILMEMSLSAFQPKTQISCETGQLYLGQFGGNWTHFLPHSFAGTGQI